MSNENNILAERLKSIMTLSNKVGVKDSSIKAKAQSSNDYAVENDVKSIKMSIRSIKGLIPKAKLGDESSVGKIVTELDAIERTLERASKFGGLFS